MAGAVDAPGHDDEREQIASGFDTLSRQGEGAAAGALAGSRVAKMESHQMRRRLGEFRAGGARRRRAACAILALCLAGLPGFAVAAAAEANTAYTSTFVGTDGLAAARADLLALQAIGGWAKLAAGPPLRYGATDTTRVSALRLRLIASADLAPAHLEGAFFDQALADGLRRFQRRHGLEPDGAVGPATATALAVPIARRLEQIDTNLARRRALPASLGARFIWVNLPAFELELVEGGERRLAMKVVVGKRRTPSPQLSAQATHYQLNPYWNVPGSIATGELAPREASSPGQLAQRRIRVFRGYGGEGEIAAESVDWNAVARGEERVFLRQEPGPGNSLGQLALQMPNSANICLHDTPERAPFLRTQRALSHGCIRLENPLDLAAALLRDDPVWSRERLAAAIGRGEQRDIILPEPLPVHLVYWTAWIDAAGTLQFRDDIYDLDRPR